MWFYLERHHQYKYAKLKGKITSKPISGTVEVKHNFDATVKTQTTLI